MKKILFIIMLLITCVSFGKNDNGDNITTEAKGMLRFVWMYHGKYNKYSKRYDFYNDILKEAVTLEEKLKEGEESVEKYIEEMEYKSLLYRKMEKLLKK